MLLALFTADSLASLPLDTVVSAGEGELRVRDRFDWMIPERLMEEETAPAQDRLDLNVASARELRDILELSAGEIERIIALRERLGRFRTTGELRALGQVLYGMLMGKRDRFRLSRAPPTAAIRLRASLSRRVPQQEDLLSPWKTYLRGSLQISRKARVGVLGEKDAGEPYRYGFTSAYLLVERLGIIERLILGDYTLHAGQGLVLGRGGGFRREFPVRESTLPEPHVYADESGYFRGVALSSSVGYSRLRCTLFYSSVRRAATFDIENAALDLDETGVFRTAARQAMWAGVRETTVGSLLEVFPWRAFELGGVIYRARYSAEKSSLADAPASHVLGAGLHFRAGFSGSSLEGEIGRTSGGGLTLAVCWVQRLGNRSRVLMGFRHYAPRSGGFFSSAPGRCGVSSNEQGATWSALFTPLSGLECTATLDLFRELGPTERIPLPSSGAESSIKVRLLVSPGRECALRWRWVGASERNAATDERGRQSWQLIQRWKQSLQLTLRHAAGSFIAADARIEMVELNWQGCPTHERGWLLAQGITLRPLAGVRIAARIAYVHTGSYASRIYLPEHDHNGAGGFVMLYGAGVRYYLFLRAEVFGILRLSAKYASSLLDPPPASENRPGEKVSTSLVSVQLEASW